MEIDAELAGYTFGEAAYVGLGPEPQLPSVGEAGDEGLGGEQPRSAIAGGERTS